MALVCALLAGCAPVGLPIADDEPTVTLPPAEVSYLAPIGDALAGVYGYRHALPAPP